MRWLRQIGDWLTHWLDRRVDGGFDADDPFNYMLAQGFQKVYLTGTDGQPYVVSNMVGWWVEEEARCWRFRAGVRDPESWPVIQDAFFYTIDRPEDLVFQFVIDGDDLCWWADDTLVLSPCTDEQLLDRLTAYPTEWTLAARRLGLGTIGAWASG